MGITVLAVEVGNPATPDVTEKVEFLIDSGAVYSVVPRPILERLGIKPLAREGFRLADGSRIEREKGIALYRYQDRVGGADVIFGEDGDSALLGAFTLEALGLSLDPLRRELKPLPQRSEDHTARHSLILDVGVSNRNAQVKDRIQCGANY